MHSKYWIDRVINHPVASFVVGEIREGMKLLKWLGIITLGLFIALLLLINLSAFWFRQADKQIRKQFEKAGIDYKIHRETFGDCTLRWVEAGNLTSDRLIFFSHGAPGGFQDFASYMMDTSLTRTHRLISMDRPGYGYSNYGKAQPSIEKQAEAAQQVLSGYQPSELIVVGYSYGGPIAAAYTARYPESIKVLVLLAPVIAPEGEKLFWFNSVLDTRLARWLLPRFIDVANEEKLHHAEALREIASDWKVIAVPVYHLHCEDDWIAPFAENTGWTKRMIPEEQLELITWNGDSHFLPGRIKDRVDPVLQEMIRNQ